MKNKTEIDSQRRFKML